MIAPALFALILISSYDDEGPDVAHWIEQLGAESFDDRVAAYKAIERLGSSALPALHAAAGAGGPRLQSRVRALIEEISRQADERRLTQPTMIPLDFPERPLGQVIDALNDRHDLGLSLRLSPALPRGMIVVPQDQPNPLKALRDRTITLKTAGPVPFWELVDRLCKAAALRYDLGPEPGLILLADRTGRGPVSDSGPFRVQLISLETLFERDFLRGPGTDGNGGDASHSGDLTVALAVLAEPGLVLHSNGPVSVTEAIDDRDRSLLPPAPRPSDRHTLPSQSTPMAARSVHAIMKLLAPDPPGARIRRLRGKVPVVVVTRRGDPLIVRLNEVVGEKSIETPDTTLVVDEVKLVRGSQSSVRVTIRPRRWDNSNANRSRRRPPNFAAFNRDRVLERLELHDAAGRKLHFSSLGQTRGADARGFYDRYQLVVTSTGENGPQRRANAVNAPAPTELRYYEQVQTTAEIPFDFHGIPMP